MNEFELRGEFITLGQFLKARAVIGSGGEAREYLASGAVRVNGQVETRRGRKLHIGDSIQLQGRRIKITGPG